MSRAERLDDFQTSLRLALDDRQSKIWTSIPAIVIDVDLGSQTISAQPAIQAILTDRQGIESNVTLPTLVNVPIVWPRAGGFSLTFPVAPGDDVLIMFASRSIDSWWQSGDVGAQVEKRMHDLSDGFAILAPTSQPKKLSAVSSDSVQLRNDTGTTFVEIDSAGKVNIQSPSEVNINSTTQVNITSDVKIKLEAPIVEVVGNLVVDGDVETTGGVDISGVPFDDHKHGGVQSGVSQTTTPQL